MKVTPDIAAPIMAKAAMYHGVAAVAGEEAGVVGTAARGPCDGEKDGYIAQDGGGNGGRSHNLYLGSNYKGIKKDGHEGG